ncbi:hypothetical protein [Pseudomonas sp. MBLB4136]|uniref:hypothetical protein n=1 Tax=Pseudomonas sp. MBLB4136 TaxID=3451558 RepID=UPI003F74E1ED
MELTKEVLDCMTTLRRRLREELALDIRLSQADSVGAMLSACRASRDEQTRQLGQCLARFSDRPFEPAAGTPASASPGGVAERPARSAQRIYRGQRVNV